jgi:transcriptional regulator of NAD metabolism
MEIHELKKNGATLQAIASEINKKHNYLLSTASLSRHFSNFHSAMRCAVEQKMVEYLTEEVDQRAAHTSKLTTLINAQFKKIAEQWNQVEPTIENLEKLLKLRYLVLEGKISLGDYDEQLQVIIQNPGTVNFNQLPLWSPAQPISQEAEIVPVSE